MDILSVPIQTGNQLVRSSSHDSSRQSASDASSGLIRIVQQLCTVIRQRSPEDASPSMPTIFANHAEYASTSYEQLASSAASSLFHARRARRRVSQWIQLRAGMGGDRGEPRGGYQRTTSGTLGYTLPHMIDELHPCQTFSDNASPLLCSVLARLQGDSSKGREGITRAELDALTACPCTALAAAPQGSQDGDVSACVGAQLRAARRPCVRLGEVLITAGLLVPLPRPPAAGGDVTGAEEGALEGRDVLYGLNTSAEGSAMISLLSSSFAELAGKAARLPPASAARTGAASPQLLPSRPGSSPGRLGSEPLGMSAAPGAGASALAHRRHVDPLKALLKPQAPLPALDALTSNLGLSLSGVRSRGYGGDGGLSVGGYGVGPWLGGAQGAAGAETAEQADHTGVLRGMQALHDASGIAPSLAFLSYLPANARTVMYAESMTDGGALLTPQMQYVEGVGNKPGLTCVSNRGQQAAGSSAAAASAGAAEVERGRKSVLRSKLAQRKAASSRTAAHSPEHTPSAVTGGGGGSGAEAGAPLPVSSPAISYDELDEAAGQDAAAIGGTDQPPLPNAPTGLPHPQGVHVVGDAPAPVDLSSPSSSTAAAAQVSAPNPQTRTEAGTERELSTAPANGTSSSPAPAPRTRGQGRKADALVITSSEGVQMRLAFPHPSRGRGVTAVALPLIGWDVPGTGPISEQDSTGAGAGGGRYRYGTRDSERRAGDAGPLDDFSARYYRPDSLSSIGNGTILTGAVLMRESLYTSPTDPIHIGLTIPSQPLSWRRDIMPRFTTTTMTGAPASGGEGGASARGRSASATSSSSRQPSAGTGAGAGAGTGLSPTSPIPGQGAPLPLPLAISLPLAASPAGSPVAEGAGAGSTGADGQPATARIALLQYDPSVPQILPPQPLSASTSKAGLSSATPSSPFSLGGSSAASPSMSPATYSRLKRSGLHPLMAVWTPACVEVSHEQYTGQGERAKSLGLPPVQPWVQKDNTGQLLLPPSAWDRWPSRGAVDGQAGLDMSESSGQGVGMDKKRPGRTVRFAEGPAAFDPTGTEAVVGAGAAPVESGSSAATTTTTSAAAAAASGSAEAGAEVERGAADGLPSAVNGAEDVTMDGTVASDGGTHGDNRPDTSAPAHVNRTSDAAAEDRLHHAVQSSEYHSEQEVLDALASFPPVPGYDSEDETLPDEHMLLLHERGALRVKKRLEKVLQEAKEAEALRKQAKKEAAWLLRAQRAQAQAAASAAKKEKGGSHEGGGGGPPASRSSSRATGAPPRSVASAAAAPPAAQAAAASASSAQPSLPAGVGDSNGGGSSSGAGPVVATTGGSREVHGVDGEQERGQGDVPSTTAAPTAMPADSVAAAGTSTGEGAAGSIMEVDAHAPPRDVPAQAGGGPPQGSGERGKKRKRGSSEAAGSTSSTAAASVGGPTASLGAPPSSPHRGPPPHAPPAKTRAVQAPTSATEHASSAARMAVPATAASGAGMGLGVAGMFTRGHSSLALHTAAVAPTPAPASLAGGATPVGQGQGGRAEGPLAQVGMSIAAPQEASTLRPALLNGSPMAGTPVETPGPVPPAPAPSPATSPLQHPSGTTNTAFPLMTAPSTIALPVVPGVASLPPVPVGPVGGGAQPTSAGPGPALGMGLPVGVAMGLGLWTSPSPSAPISSVPPVPVLLPPPTEHGPHGGIIMLPGGMGRQEYMAALGQIAEMSKRLAPSTGGTHASPSVHRQAPGVGGGGAGGAAHSPTSLAGSALMGLSAGARIPSPAAGQGQGQGRKQGSPPQQPVVQASTQSSLTRLQPPK